MEKQTPPVAFLVEALHDDLVVAWKLCRHVDEARDTASEFARHYEMVRTRGLHFAPARSNTQ